MPVANDLVEQLVTLVAQIVYQLPSAGLFRINMFHFASIDIAAQLVRLPDALPRDLEARWPAPLPTPGRRVLRPPGSPSLRYLRDCHRTKGLLSGGMRENEFYSSGKLLVYNQAKQEESTAIIKIKQLH